MVASRGEKNRARSPPSFYHSFFREINRKKVKCVKSYFIIGEISFQNRLLSVFFVCNILIVNIVR